MKETTLKLTEADGPKSLSPKETQRFQRLTLIIVKGMKSFLDVGSALAEVRNKKLYRGTFQNWDDYLSTTLGMERSYATRMINARNVAVQLQSMLSIGNISQFPVNESQVRPLHKLPTPELRARAWREAVEANPGSPPTAAAVAESVKILLSEGSPPEPGSDAGQEKAPETQAEGGEAIAPEAGTEPLAEESSGDVVVLPPTSDSEATVQAVGHGGHDTATDRVDAVLSGGITLPCVLWQTGYLDAKLMQRKLDELGLWDGTDPRRIVVLQELLIRIAGHLNQVVDGDRTEEMRNGISHLFREFVVNLPVIATWPRDTDPGNEGKAAPRPDGGSRPVATDPSAADPTPANSSQK